MNPVFLNRKIPSEQNNVKDIHCDGRNFHTAVVPADDNSLKQNNVNKNADNLGEQKYILVVILSLCPLIPPLLLPPVILIMDYTRLLLDG